MNLGFLGKQRMRAASMVLLVGFAFSLLLSSAMAEVEGNKEEEWPELKEDQYDDDAVCNFIDARAYEAEIRVEDNEKNISFDESLTYDPVFQYKDDFIYVEYWVGKFDDILEVMPQKFIVNALYLRDRNKHHLLSRLGINPNMESEEISVRCQNSHVKLKFNDQELIEVKIIIDFMY